MAHGIKYVLLWLIALAPVVFCGHWGSWSRWTKCSKLCPEGVRHRWRLCLGNWRCFGTKIESQKCYNGDLCASTGMTTGVSVLAEALCYDPAYPEDYRGYASATKSGLTCQAWNSQSPREHEYTPKRYPDSNLIENYCRSPDGRQAPWCFTTSGSKRWETCSIPICPGPTEVDTSTSTTATTPMPSPLLLECGLVSETSDNEIPENIVGGVEAKKGSIPWQASIRIRGIHYCGGSLIHENWILTAAHCLFTPDPNEYKAILGDHERFIREYTELEVSFSRIVRHEGYVKRTFANDIALMKMPEPVSFNDFIGPICLPKKGEISIPHERVIVSGWGTTKGTGSNKVLNVAKVPVISNSRCRELQRGILPKMMCAGYLVGGVDACQGDSGGPLYKKTGKRKYELVGLVSWGYGCALENKPGVYTRVSGYIQWINNTLANYQNEE